MALKIHTTTTACLLLFLEFTFCMGNLTAVYLSMPMTTRMKVERYSVNIWKNLTILQTMFPANHSTVYIHTASAMRQKKLTIMSATARLAINQYTEEWLLEIFLRMDSKVSTLPRMATVAIEQRTMTLTRVLEENCGACFRISGQSVILTHWERLAGNTSVIFTSGKDG